MFPVDFRAAASATLGEEVTSRTFSEGLGTLMSRSSSGEYESIESLKLCVRRSTTGSSFLMSIVARLVRLVGEMPASMRRAVMYSRIPDGSQFSRHPKPRESTCGR